MEPILSRFVLHFYCLINSDLLFGRLILIRGAREIFIGGVAKGTKFLLTREQSLSILYKMTMTYSTNEGEKCGSGVQPQKILSYAHFQLKKRLFFKSYLSKLCVLLLGSNSKYKLLAMHLKYLQKGIRKV